MSYFRQGDPWVEAAESSDPVDWLIMALRDPDYHVRQHAAEALRGAGDPRAVPPLINLLSQSGGESRETAAGALAAIGASALERLLADLESPDPAAQADAAEALRGFSPLPWTH